MKEILSTKNELIKKVAKLHRRKERQKENLYIMEGFHLIEEAYQNGAKMKYIFVTHKAYQQYLAFFEPLSEQVILVSKEIIDKLSDLPTPQGMIAVAEMSKIDLDLHQGKWLLLDYVQDPGNVGTMIRTADAAGFDGVILGEGCADVYATKTLRSMQGSQFHLKVIQADLYQVIQQLKAARVKVYATELNKEAKQYQELPYHENVAIIMGNEGQGVRSEILKLADESVYIPIYGQAESLNVGVAAGIMMYGLIRKK